MDAKQSDSHISLSGSAHDEPTDQQSVKKPVKARSRTDSGWAWVVVVGSFVVYFTSMGFSSSLSVYLTIWMDYYDSSAVTVGLVVSIAVVIRGLLSPAAGALCSRYGPRIVTMVSGVLVVFGISLASQSPNIELLILCNGVVAIGLSMVFVASVHVLGMYFNKKYALAVGLSSAGISTGQLAYPPLLSHLIDQYGWRGSMLISAAISLHIIAAGALMRPFGKRRRRKKAGDGETEHDVSGQDTATVRSSATRMEDETSATQSPTGAGEDPRELDSSDESDVEQGDKGDMTVILADNTDDQDELITDGHGDSTEGTVNPFVAAMAEDGIEQLRPPEDVSDDGRRSFWENLVHYPTKLKHFILDTFGLRRLLHNMRFVLTAIVSFGHGFGRLGIVYIVARAESVGVELSSSALLLSIFGAGSVLARITHGWFVDRKYITAEMAYALALVGLGLNIFVTPFVGTFAPLAVLAVLLGMAAGTGASIVMVIVRSQVRQSEASVAIGIMLLFASVGSLAGIFVSGVSYDTTDSYNIAFFTGGIVLLVASFLCVVVYFLQKAKHFRRNLPAAVFYVKMPRKTRAPSVASKPEEEEDLGIVNPVSELTEEGVLGDFEVDPDGDIFETVDGLREVGEMEGIENPMAEVEEQEDNVAREGEDSYRAPTEDTTGTSDCDPRELAEETATDCNAGEGDDASLSSSDSSTSSLP